MSVLETENEITAVGIVEDENNLFVIWQALKQKSLIFWMTFLSIMITGTIFNIAYIPKYTYTQILRVPSYLNGKNALVPLMSADYVADKIKKIYLPLELEKYNVLHKKNKITFENNSIIINNGLSQEKKDLFVSLSFKGAYGLMSAYNEIIQGIIADLQLDKEAFFKDRLSYLNDSLQMLQRQKEEILENLNLLKVSETRDQGMASILLQKKYLDNLVILETKINRGKNEINSLAQMSALSDLIRSEKPSTPSNTVIMLLFFILGLMGGFFAVFIRRVFTKNMLK